MRHFSDQELKGLISVPEAVAALETAFAALARSEASAQPRLTIGSGNLELSTMSAILPASRYCAAKVYTQTGGQYHFVVACGFSGHGLMHAPAVGRALAELVVHGRYEAIDLARMGYQRVLDGKPYAESGII